MFRYKLVQFNVSYLVIFVATSGEMLSEWHSDKQYGCKVGIGATDILQTLMGDGLFFPNSKGALNIAQNVS